MTNRTNVLPLLLFFGCSFVLHLVWEHGQMSLYENMDGMSFWSLDALVRCLFATATGDMAFTLTLFLAVAVSHKSLTWLSNPAAYTHPATWVLPIVVGSLLATSFELWAVYVARWWQYGPMPLIPHLRVGVTPILQMIVVPLATIAFCWWWIARRSGRQI